MSNGTDTPAAGSLVADQPHPTNLQAHDSVAENPPPQIARPSAVKREWVGSKEEQKAKRDRTKLAFVTIVAFCVGIPLFIIGWNSNGVLQYLGFIGIAFVATGLGSLFTFPFTVSKEKQKFDEKSELLKLAANVSSAVERVDDQLTLPTLIRLNRAEMAEYHAIVKAQAQRAFRHSQASMIAGLVILLAGAVTVVVPEVPNQAKYAVAALTALGTAIAGFITRTFLRSHEMGVSQLNRFFRQPLVSSYLLTAERVALQLGGESMNICLQKIVQQAINTADSAESDLGGPATYSSHPRFARRKGKTSKSADSADAGQSTGLNPVG
jgi:hypothetical protein